ncbi:MAG: SH3 domain-containing protein [Mariprofundaceae bacterium]
MGRIILLCLMLLSQSSCVVVSAVGGGLVDGALYMFKTEKESLPLSLNQTLIGTQRTLETLRLQANLVEPIAGGYILEFANQKLSGSITLTEETENLTTVSARIHKGLSRESSVEKAIFEGIRSASKEVQGTERFDFSRYNNIRARPSRQARRVGWYIPHSQLNVSKVKQKGWLRVKMPSGKTAFLKGQIVKKEKTQ